MSLNWTIIQELLILILLPCYYKPCSQRKISLALINPCIIGCETELFRTPLANKLDFRALHKV